MIPKGNISDQIHVKSFSASSFEKTPDASYTPTSILLQDPAFELYDGVSKGAAVLTLAAVAHLVATNIELAERVQGTHLTVAHIG